MKKYKVEFFRVKHLFKKHLPIQVVIKLQFWALRVEMIGIEETRKIPSFHDEPLKGDRSGQRSIRLNRSYRAFYEIRENNEIILVDVVEVNKHEY